MISGNPRDALFVALLEFSFLFHYSGYFPLVRGARPRGKPDESVRNAFRCPPSVSAPSGSVATRDDTGQLSNVNSPQRRYIPSNVAGEMYVYLMTHKERSDSDAFALCPPRFDGT